MAAPAAQSSPAATQLAQLDAQIAEASKTLGPNHPQMVQMRTLNMDRELLEEKVGFPREHGIGIERFIETLRRELPGTQLGSKTPFVGRARAYVS